MIPLRLGKSCAKIIISIKYEARIKKLYISIWNICYNVGVRFEKLRKIKSHLHECLTIDKYWE